VHVTFVTKVNEECRDAIRSGIVNVVSAIPWAFKHDDQIRFATVKSSIGGEFM
jgi:hypothetical protein